jgi:glycosyltransferase involved in cell wall biosynthesis
VRHLHFRVEPGGGPHGYLFNLRQAAASAGERGPVTLEIEALVPSRQPGAPPLARLRALLESTPGLRRLNWELRGEFALRFERGAREWQRNWDGIGRAECRAQFECDLLFAHDIFLAQRLVRFCPRESRERLVLMTHAPSFAAHQIAGDLLPDAPEASWRDEPCVRRLRERELEVMQAARAVAWPSPGAREGYPEWMELARRGSARDVYVRTGVPRPVPKAGSRELRERWGVPAGRKVALFMGRPHPHKGFDRFVDWADGARRVGAREWTFVFAGAPPKWSRRDLSALHAVGYERDNAAAYLAADLVLLPNRHSYLDIGLLECLALEAAVVASPTGGHRDVMRLCPSLPAIPDGAPEASWAALESLNGEAGSTARRRAHGEAWGRHFSPETFLREHRAAAEAVLAAHAPASTEAAC